MLIELPPRIDDRTNARVVMLAKELKARCASRLRDVVVGYSSVTVYFDPLTMDMGWLEREARAADDGLRESAAIRGARIEVPVRYGGESGPDLQDVAAFAGLSQADVIAIHSSATYRVYMMGFVPGFAYMAVVDPRIAPPRRGSPRERVPAGSVAIAAGQTGIYPIETPGGWHVIGRTDLKPYDPIRADPFLFHPGDEVRFTVVPVASAGGPS
jgi:inhibitor of KinA